MRLLWLVMRFLSVSVLVGLRIILRVVVCRRLLCIVRIRLRSRVDTWRGLNMVGLGWLVMLMMRFRITLLFRNGGLFVRWDLC